MKNNRIKSYTQAIYDIAKENNKLEDYLDISLAFLKVFKDNEKLLFYLGNHNIAFDDKKNLIKFVVEDKFYQNWLLILIKDGMQSYIKNCIESFINIYNYENKILKGIIWTTEEINEEVFLKINDKVEQKFKKRVILENKINKEILGGIRIEVGDTVWDNTIKNKLKQLMKLKGSDLNE